MCPKSKIKDHKIEVYCNKRLYVEENKTNLYLQVVNSDAD